MTQEEQSVIFKKEILVQNKKPPKTAVFRGSDNIFYDVLLVKLPSKIRT
jgi:hypothetical protein